MENRGAITCWSKNHRLPDVTFRLINLFLFYQTTSLSDNLWVKIILVQATGRILSLCMLSNFITRKKCAYFNRFIPLINYQCFTLFWSLIFWFFNAFTRHWFIRAILSWPHEWHFIILFQNIIICTRCSVCGISWSSHRLHARPIFVRNTLLFLISFTNDPLWFRRLHLFSTIYKLL